MGLGFDLSSESKACWQGLAGRRVRQVFHDDPVSSKAGIVSWVGVQSKRSGGELLKTR